MAVDLSEADRRKDEFLATLAHELRNPLAPIRNGIELLKRDRRATTPQPHGVLGVMERQMEHMVRLVDDLIDVSRITRNKLELRKQHVELGQVVRTRDRSQPAADRRPRATSWRCRLPATPVHLDADRDPAGAGVRQPAQQRRPSTPTAAATISVRAERQGDEVRGQRQRQRQRHPGATCCPRCSTCSPSSTARWSARRAASASACRWSSAWSSCTAARSRCTATGPGMRQRVDVRLPAALRRRRRPATARRGRRAAPAPRRRDPGRRRQPRRRRQPGQAAAR